MSTILPDQMVANKMNMIIVDQLNDRRPGNFGPHRAQGLTEDATDVRDVPLLLQQLRPETEQFWRGGDAFVRAATKSRTINACRLQSVSSPQHDRGTAWLPRTCMLSFTLSGRDGMLRRPALGDWVHVTRQPHETWECVQMFRVAGWHDGMFCSLNTEDLDEFSAASKKILAQ